MTPCQRPEEPRPRGRWKHGPIPVIGLIGGIGSGKSQVASLLAARGAAVIDADALGHELLEDPRVRSRIVERFGAGILARPGREGAPVPPVDRRALGAIVFADATARRALEAILHPPMRTGIRTRIDRETERGSAPLVVLDAAVLLEAGWDDLCDRIVFVEAPRSERLRRVAQARGWSEATVTARERAQRPCGEKQRHAHWIVRNDAGIDRLQEEVDRLVSWLQDSTPPSDESSPPRREASADALAGPAPSRRGGNSPAPLGRLS
jgi:dephospho-CoA kinase